MSPRTPLLVGLVLIAATVSLTWFVMSTSKDKFGEDATYALFADFSDASGIRWKTRVQINGIDVGKIDDITHVRDDEGRLLARVKLSLLNEYTVYDNAVLRKAAESLLGDFRLDLSPGTADHAALKPGEVIKNVQSLSDMDAIQSELKQVARNVNNVTESFSKVLAGPEGEGSLKAILAAVEKSMDAIEQTTGALSSTISRNDAVINQLVQDLGKFAHALANTTQQNGALTTTAENLASLTGRLDNISKSLQDMVEGDPGRTGTLKATVDQLNDSLNRVNAIARKIDEGQGTVGRIVNDPAIADKVEQTLDDASEFVGSLSRLQTEIELRGEYDVPMFTQAADDPNKLQPSIKNTLGVRISPKPDKYYLIEAVSDPRGKQTRTVTTTSTDGGADTTVNETVTAYNDLKFSAQFAKRYYFLTLRFGIIENTGGLGFNLHGLKDRLELRVDAFDFDRRDQTRENSPILPRLRSAGMYEFVRHLYLQGGIDDPLNRRLTTWFLGGMLRFTDDDLKSLMTVAP